eukprot:1137474-Pelagomonas_calceolata.AAC.1
MEGDLSLDGVIFTPHTLEPLKELDIDTHKVTNLAPKLHAHAVQYAYKLASIRCATEKTSFNSSTRSGTGYWTKQKAKPTNCAVPGGGGGGAAAVA